MNQHPSKHLLRSTGNRPWALTLAAATTLGLGCAHTQGPSTPASSASPPVTTYEMEPIKITAVNGPDGVHVEAYDASELFEQASKALSEKRYDAAISAYDRLLREFEHESQDGRYTRAAIYNAGLAHQGKKDWAGAIVRFKALSEGYPDSSDAKDALFQLGSTYAEMSNWPASVQVFAQVLDRKDLLADDRLEALARRGFAQFQLHDIDTAERTFQSAVSYFHQIEASERIETDFYLALSQYHLGEVNHARFRAAPLRLPQRQMSADLDEKARLLLVSQRQYIDTIKLGNVEWAAASGFQIGSLYEELYDAFMAAPVPPELSQPAEREKLDIYNGELRKKIRILLEKSVRTHEANLLMMERMSVRNEWREKSKLAFAKLQSLLDPSLRPPISTAEPSIMAPSPVTAPPSSSAAAGPQPTIPPSRPGASIQPSEPGAPLNPSVPASASPAPASEPSLRHPLEGPTRQIL
jgi:TolA-binding protein